MDMGRAGFSGLPALCTSQGHLFTFEGRAFLQAIFSGMSDGAALPFTGPQRCPNSEIRAKSWVCKAASATHSLCCPASQQKHLGPWRRMTGEGSRRFTQGTGQTDLKLTGREASSEREVRNSSKQPSSPVQCSVSFPSAGDPNQHGYK